MGLDEMLKFNDYTLEDFKKESYERRLETILKMVDSINKAVLHVYLVPNKVYTYKIEVLGDTLKCLNILEEFQRNREIARGIASVLYDIYELSDISVVAKGMGYNYILTSFGKDMQSFVSYILKKYSELDVDLSPLLTLTVEERRRGKDPLEVFRLIYKKGMIWRAEIEEMFPRFPVYRYLVLFDRLGLVERLRYEVNRKIIKDVLECLEDLDCQKMYKVVIVSFSLFKKAVEYLKDKEIVSKKELAKSLNISESYTNLLIDDLKSKRVLYETGTLVKITEKGKRVYEEIIKPILEVAKEPDNITKYKVELNNMDRLRLLELISKKSTYGGRERLY